MSILNRIVLLITFLLSLFGIYSYLNFIPYDLYAVSPLFLWNSKLFIAHITDSFLFNKYLSLFFIQFFYSKPVAAIILALLVTAVFVSFRRFLSYFSASDLIINTGSLSVVAGLFLIPDKNIINDLIGLLIILWSVLLLKKYSDRKNIFWWTLIVGFILWWTIQPFFLLWLILLPLTLLTGNRKLAYKTFWANLVLAVVLYGGRYLFMNFTPQSACWLFIRDYISVKYLLLFLLIIFVPVVIKYLNRKKPVLILTTCILAVLCANGVKYVLDSSVRNTEAIVKYKFNSEEWISLLNYAINKPELSQTSAMCVNYALYTDNHLKDYAFRFDQRYSENGLLPKFELNESEQASRNFFYNRNAILLSEIYYHLGLYSMSRRIAIDFIAHFENQPQALLILTKSNLAFGEKSSAEKYAAILEQNPIYRKKAKELICNSEKKYAGEGAADVAISSSPLTNLYLLLMSPEKNQMALEYYISYSILARDFTTIPFIIDKLTEYGYTEMPQDFEYFTYLARAFYKEPFSMGNIKTNTKRYIKYASFYEKMKSVKNQEKAKEAVKDYRHSYMYYFFFN